MTQRAKAAISKDNMNIVGQGLQTTPDRGGEQTEACGKNSEDGSAPAAAVMGTAWSSQPDSPKDFSMVDQVMAVNRSLVQQIDALRLRLQVDSRHHESARSQFLQDANEKLKTRDFAIVDLKDELKSKQAAVVSLTEENQKKKTEIQSLQHTINALKKDVEDSKFYVDDIQQNLNILLEEKEKLESGAAYREKEELIQKLSKGIEEMRSNFSKLERELAKAKEVMKCQWDEMRVLRLQNENMRTDIKEIKELLLAGDANADHHGPMYSMGALKPTLPALSNNARRAVPGQKKPLG